MKRFDLKLAVRAFREKLILEQLQANDFNRCLTARMLGIHRNTVTRVVVKYRLSRWKAKTAHSGE